MAFTRAERAAIEQARAELGPRVQISDEALDRMIRGGTHDERQVALKRGYHRQMGERGKVDVRSINPRPQRDRRGEQAIRRNWNIVLKAIVPEHIHTGKKLENATQLRKAMRER